MHGMKAFSHKFDCVPMSRYEFGALKRNENLRTSMYKTKIYVTTKFRTRRCITVLL